MKENNFVNAYIRILKAGSVILFSLVFACVEPYEPKTETFESTLIVEGMLTDEFKNQEITLSKSYPLEQDTILHLDNALVEIVSDDGETFRFRNNGNGKYSSIQPFQALDDHSYHLEIETSDGSLYVSDEEKLVGHAELEDLYAEKTLNGDGIPGIGIYVSKNLGDDPNYYLYSYEESYKIVSPYTRNRKIVADGDYGFHFEPVTEEREVCYNTVSSNKSVLSNTSRFNSASQEALITFLKINNKKIEHRYSILVNQKLISEEAYNFYKTLQDLSGSSNVFSQQQPGFLPGNISSVNNSDENVVGYFTIASTSKKRIWLNFLDYFSIDERPDPTRECSLSKPKTERINGFVSAGVLQYWTDNLEPTPTEGPYIMVNLSCIDCRVLGKVEKPDFWVDEEN